MKIRISKAELMEAMGMGYYYWPDAPDFIEVSTEKEEAKSEASQCNCNGPYTCKVHGGKYTFCSDFKCLCHRQPIKITPSGRIDYCINCDAEHGYDCPKDAAPIKPIALIAPICTCKNNGDYQRHHTELEEHYNRLARTVNALIERKN